MVLNLESEGVMRRNLVPLIIAGVVIFNLTRICYADELSELKVQMKAMQKQMEEMQEKIEILEAERQAKIETPEEMEEKPLFVKIGQGDLEISGFAQVLHRHYKLDSQNDSFSLPRVRLKFDGHAIPELGYRVQIDVAASSDILRDAYIKYTKYPFANLIVGQTFIPFSEEQLYSTASLEFIDRTQVTSTLSYDRDIGVQLLGNVLNKKLSYGAGVFNGSGQ